MRRNFVVPVLAAMMAIPTTQAIELADEDASIKFGIRLQSRIEIANASDSNGDDHDIQEDATTDDPQNINFYLPRARLYMKGKYTGGWRYELTFMGDKIGSKGSSDGGDVGVRYAKIGKEFKSGDLKHGITFGLTKPQMLSSHTDSSSRFLFYGARLNNRLKPVDRVMGLEYSVKGPVFNAFARISEADADGDDNNDLYFSLRVETGLSQDMHIKKRTESFTGKEGFGHQLGLGLGIKSDGNDDEDGETVFTVDYLLHMDQLTALAEFSYLTPEEGDDDEMAFTAQAGWAIPMDNMVVEPAVRLTLLDLDTDNDDEETEYVENGKESGFYFDAGVNMYFDGHSNKLGLYLTSFTPEEGDGDAFIVRAQHQLNF